MTTSKPKPKKSYKARSAREAQLAGYGGPAYWDYLEEKAEEYVRKGINRNAFTQTLAEALRGNDGD
jgi:hypothetical protein